MLASDCVSRDKSDKIKLYLMNHEWIWVFVELTLMTVLNST